MSDPKAPQKTPSQLAAYADLFQRLLDCTLLLDPNSFVILEANSACERVLGVPTEKLVGRSLLSWVDESQHDDFGKAMRVAMRRYYPRQFDSRWKLPDGRMIHMEILACPLSLSDQRESLQVIARDISFKREAEMKLPSLLSELKAANAKLEVLSNEDEMTKLFNFRHFKTELQKEHLRSARYATEYSIVFCDIDYFKKYNDRNGHPAGDALLREFAKVLQKCCRSSDLPARYGGEEFAVICPGVSAEGAVILAERIRSSVAEMDFAHGSYQPDGKLTVSVGVSSFPVNGASAEDILKAADEAVYASKAAGRNRVTVAAARALKKSA